jgi:glycerol-3-phosphate O-acyltransferase
LFLLLRNTEIERTISALTRSLPIEYERSEKKWQKLYEEMMRNFFLELLSTQSVIFSTMDPALSKPP